jgi:hypothetical protein
VGDDGPGDVETEHVESSEWWEALTRCSGGVMRRE